jgi:hypothetical protein
MLLSQNINKKYIFMLLLLLLLFYFCEKVSLGHNPFYGSIANLIA